MKSRLVDITELAESTYGIVPTDLHDTYPHVNVKENSVCISRPEYSIIQDIVSAGYKISYSMIKIRDIDSFKGLINKNNSIKNTPFYIDYIIDISFCTSPYHDCSTNGLLVLTEQLKDTTGFEDLKWRFSNGLDLYGHKEQKRSEWFLKQMKHVDHKNIIMDLTNFDVVDYYKNLLPNANINFYTFFDIRWLSNNINNELYINDNKNKTKHFLCLNRMWKPHRTNIWHYITENDLKKKFYYSYITEGVYLEGEAEHVSTEIEQNGYNELLTVQDSPPHDLVKDCYAFLCTETFFYKYEVESMTIWWRGEDGDAIEPPEDWLSDAMFEHSYITEKSFKSAYCELPMLIAGLPNSLKTWRRMGFESFPEFFDESYDSEYDDGKRMQMVLHEMEKFCNTDIEDIHKIYYSDSVQQKLKRNKQNFFKMIRENRYWEWAKFKYKPGINTVVDQVFNSEF